MITLSDNPNLDWDLYADDEITQKYWEEYGGMKSPALTDFLIKCIYVLFYLSSLIFVIFARTHWWQRIHFFLFYVILNQSFFYVRIGSKGCETRLFFVFICGLLYILLEEFFCGSNGWLGRGGRDPSPTANVPLPKKNKKSKVYNKTKHGSIQESYEVPLLSTVPFGKGTILYQYPVPGDGFCGIYAVLSCVRELRANKNINYMFTHKLEEVFYNGFLRPILQEFLEHFNVISSMSRDPNNPKIRIAGTSNDPLVLALVEDVNLIQEFLDTSRLPNNLSINTLVVFSRFLGLTPVFDTDEMPEKGSNFIVLCTRPQPCAKPCSQVVLVNGHFTPYLTELQDKFYSYEEYWNNLLLRYTTLHYAPPTTPGKKGVYQQYHLFKQTSQSATVVGLLTKRNKPVYYEPNKGALPSQPNILELLQQSKNNDADSFDESENPVKPEGKKKKNDLITGLTEQGFNYTCFFNCKNDSKLDLFIKSHNIGRTVERPQLYCHAFLRTVADYYYLSSLDYARRINSALICDVASKLDKVFKWVTLIRDRWRPSRPIIDPFDRAFVDLRLPKIPNTQPVSFQPLNADLPFGSDMTYVLNDVHYHPGIMDAFRHSVGEIRALVTGIYYTPRAGTFSYFDDEGTYTINDNGTMSSLVNGNTKPYTHDVPTLTRGSTNILIRNDHTFLSFEPISETQIGPDAWFIQWYVREGPFFQGTIIPFRMDVDVAIIPKEYTLKFISSVMNSLLLEVKAGIPLFEDSNHGLDERTILYTPDPAVYQVLYTHINPTTDYRSLVMSYKNAKFLLSKEYENYDAEKTLLTMLCVIQDHNRQVDALHQFNLHPDNQTQELKTIVDKPTFYRYSLSVSVFLSMFLYCLVRSSSFWWIFQNGFILYPLALLALTLFSFSWRHVFRPMYVTNHNVGDHQPNTKTMLPAFFRLLFVRLRGGRLERVEADHKEPIDNQKGYWPWGNIYCSMEKRTRALLCTCRSTYKKIFRPTTVYTVHFGGCKRNIDSAIFSRQFNAKKFPSHEGRSEYLAYADQQVRGYEDRFSRWINSAPDELFSVEAWLAEVVPKKRDQYRRAFNKFLEDGLLRTKVEFFSKTDEVHSVNDKKKPRPRNIALPSIEVRAVGSYLARIMIKFLKTVEPGFISGYNLESLSAKFAKDFRKFLPFTQRFWYKGDGDSHDSHMHAEWIEGVDHKFLRLYLPRILMRTPIPTAFYGVVLHVFTLNTLRATSCLGMKLNFSGTVPSGHPFRTTLFNTLRTLYLHQLVLVRNGIVGHVWAAGDDFIGFALSHKIKAYYDEVMSSQSVGLHGYGYVIRDFVVGPLEQMDFLSKAVVTDGFRVHFLRLPEKAANCAIYTDKIGNLSLPDYCRLQAISLLDLPKEMLYYAYRFVALAGQRLSAQARALLFYDWKYRLTKKDFSTDELSSLYFTLNPKSFKVVTPKMLDELAQFRDSYKAESRRALPKHICQVPNYTYTSEIGFDCVCPCGS
jgi:hypothetical protein